MTLSSAAGAAAGVLAVVASAVALRFLLDRTGRDCRRQEQREHEDRDKEVAQCPFDPSKRKGYLSWDDYFMAIAFLSSERSKDPNRQVGACLVSQNGVILGIGYNGFPRGCSDDKLPWAKKSRNGDPLETKYPYVCHAEVNAILNTNHASAAGQRLYVTMFPCNECAKVIIQAGVSEVIYFVEKKTSVSDSQYIASRKLLSLAGVMRVLWGGSIELPGTNEFYQKVCGDNPSYTVQVRKHRPQKQQIVINFRE